MALGAQYRSVIWMFLRESLLIVAVGAILALGAAWATTRLVTSLLFGVTPMDPAAIAVATFVMIASCALAAYLPARRASRVDPMTVLRYE